MNVIDAFMRQWFWLVGILVVLINGVILYFRAKKIVREKPELASGYYLIIRGLITWILFPAVIMGIGCTVGGINNVEEFMRPIHGGPYALAFFGSVFLAWIVGTRWLFFQGGAEMLVQHPGIFNRDFKDPKAVKLYWILCLSGGILGFIFILISDITRS